MYINMHTYPQFSRLCFHTLSQKGHYSPLPCSLETPSGNIEVVHKFGNHSKTFHTSIAFTVHSDIEKYC